MPIVPINSSNKDLFHKVPKSIYSGDANYIPHLIQDIDKRFNPETNKLYKTGGKAQQWVLTDEKKNPIGRIAAFINPKTINSHGMKVGGLGFFECINNQRAANELFNTAIDWLKNEGIEAVDGPINFGERDQFWGLLVDNFTAFNSYGMNYNPPYYKELFENYGFKTYFEQYVFWRSLDRDAESFFYQKSEKIRSNPDFKVITAKGLNNDEIANYFLQVYNAAWATMPGFKEMKLAQAQGVVKSLAPIMDKNILFFAMMKEKPVGFYINIPELNEFFQYVDGNLNLWGKIKFFYRLKTKKRNRMVGIVFGVDKEYHGRGVDGALIIKAGDTVVKKNLYKETLLTWIGDFNLPMLQVINELGVERFKTLITYRYLFDRTKPFERCPYVGKKREN